MFGNLGDMNKMLGNLGNMQENAAKLQAELEAKTFNVKSGGGMLDITVNGNGVIQDINIDDSLLADKATLQILLIGAINDANKMVETNKQQSAMGMLGGMGV